MMKANTHLTRFSVSRRGYTLTNMYPTHDGAASFSYRILLGWRSTTQVSVQQQSSFKLSLRQNLDIVWVTEAHQCGSNFKDMVDAIERSEMIGTSNGSYKDNMGT
jgi:hypothetical protein